MYTGQEMLQRVKGLASQRREHTSQRTDQDEDNRTMAIL